MSRREGRPYDYVWQFCRKIEEEDGKIKKNHRIQCQALVSAKADILRTHLSKCLIKQVNTHTNYADLR